VYIAISQCEDILNQGGEISDQTKADSGGLTRNLEEIQTFVQKKARQKLYQRILKHGSDERKVHAYRGQLQQWQGKFRLNQDRSIHDSLQDIIDEKLQKHDQEEHAARKAKDLSKFQELNKTRPGVSSASPPPLPSVEKPLPKIILSRNPETEDLPPISRPPNQVSQTNDKAHKPASIKGETDAKRKERLEEERRLKKAERERWRKSEQEFIQLPEAKIDDDENVLLKSNDAKAVFLPIIQKTPSRQSLPPVSLSHDDAPTPTAAANNEDHKIAEDLHYQLQKELEAEDDRKALLLAAKMQREWEAEEEATERRTTSSTRSEKQNLSAEERPDVVEYDNEKETPSSLGGAHSIPISYPIYSRPHSPRLNPRQSPY
jgi:hypothetical protein